MTDRLPGTKFLLFTIVCIIAAGYVAAVSGNIELNRLVPTVFPFLDDAGVFEVELDEAAGLVVGDDVRIAGVDVGRVNDIRLEEGLAVVTFEVSESVRPTTEWKAGARWRNAIGQRFLYLYPAEGGVPLVSGPGQGESGRIPVENAVAVADLAAFVNELTPLLEALNPAQQNKLTSALNDVLVGREDDIQSLVSNLTELADTVSGQEPEVRAVIANANLLLTELNSRDDDLLAFIDDLSLVGATLVDRNDQLLNAAVDITEVQSQLGRLISTNDDGIANSLADLSEITDRIGRNRDDFEATIGNLPEGLTSYALTSRQGQWFNVRGVAVQVQMNGMVVYCATESGGTCAFPNDPRAGGAPEPTPTSGPGPQPTSGEGPVEPPTPPPVLAGAYLNMSQQPLNGLGAAVAGPIDLITQLAAPGATSPSQTAGGG